MADVSWKPTLHPRTGDMLCPCYQACNSGPYAGCPGILERYPSGKWACHCGHHVAEQEPSHG